MVVYPERSSPANPARTPLMIYTKKMIGSVSSTPRSEALSPDGTVESVSETMMDHSTNIVYRACDRAIDLAQTKESVEKFAAEFYDRMLDWRWQRSKGKMELYK